MPVDVDLFKEIQRFVCEDCGLRGQARVTKHRDLVCAKCFPESPDALCAHCHQPVDRYDASGHAWCNRCYAAWTDTCKPLSGVICPNCFQSQTYQQGLDGVWICISCKQSYVWSCYRIGRKPSVPDPDKSPKLSTSPHQKEKPMSKKTQPPLPTMPEPVIKLSHSQLETWEQCNLRWRFNKIDKLPQAPSEALILGTAFHAALEADGRASDRLTDYQLLAVFEETFQMELAKADPIGLISNEKRIGMRRKAQLMILEYIKTVQPHYQPLEIEKDFMFRLSDEVSFTGRIDAVTASSIVDWKTASKPWTPGDQHHKDQATAYLIARPDATRVSFAVFAPNGESCSFQSLATERTDEQKALYRAKVLKVADEIRAAKVSGEFAANPGPLCGWCGFLGNCSAGEAWLKLHGRVPQVPVLRNVTTQTGQPGEIADADATQRLPA